MNQEPRILRINEVVALVHTSRATIYRLIGKGQFPKPVSIGNRSKGWIKSDVDLWLRAREPESIDMF
mgnify:CR=1 FL=1